MYLGDIMNRVIERKNHLEKKISNIEKINSDYNNKIQKNETILNNYKLSVYTGRIITITSGLLITLILSIIEQAIFGIPGTKPFTVIMPSTLPVVIISTINMIPLALGISGFIKAPKIVQKEMNINPKQLVMDNQHYDRMIEYNLKDIKTLNTLLEEVEYLSNEMCANYGNVEDDVVNNEIKNKVLKLVKKY